MCRVPGTPWETAVRDTWPMYPTIPRSIGCSASHLYLHAQSPIEPAEPVWTGTVRMSPALWTHFDIQGSAQRLVTARAQSNVLPSQHHAFCCVCTPWPRQGRGLEILTDVGIKKLLTMRHLAQGTLTSIPLHPLIRLFVLHFFCGLGRGFQVWVMMSSSANPTLTPSFALLPASPFLNLNAATHSARPIVCSMFKASIKGIPNNQDITCRDIRNTHIMATKPPRERFGLVRLCQVILV